MSTLLNTQQAAERLGLARATLAKLRAQGGGPPFVKLGAKVLYPEAELCAWLEGQPRHTSTAQTTTREARRRRGRPHRDGSAA